MNILVTGGALIKAGHAIPVNELPRRPGGSARLVASSEKIKRELGWKPAHDDLEEIISSAWNWHTSKGI